MKLDFQNSIHANTCPNSMLSEYDTYFQVGITRTDKILVSNQKVLA